MANIQERRDKSGKLISYSIRVFRGRSPDGKQLKPWTATFEVSPTWTEKSARKKAEAFAATFEAQCKAGIASDSRRKFSEYCDYVIDLKEQRGAKHSTIASYRDLAKRIYPHIGHLKLKDLRADHLNSLYTELSKTAFKSTAAKSKVNLPAILKEQHTTRAAISKSTGLAECTVSAAVRGDSVSIKTARAVSDALGLKYEKRKPRPVCKNRNGASPVDLYGAQTSREGRAGPVQRRCQSGPTEGGKEGRKLFSAEGVSRYS